MKYIKKYEGYFKIGDKVICIDSKTYPSSLTIGKEYTIKKIDIARGFCKVINDSGELEGFFNKRFSTPLEYQANKYNL